MEPRTRFSLVYVIAAVLGLLLIQHFVEESLTMRPLPYSEFVKLLGEGKVEEVVIGANEPTRPPSNGDLSRQ